MNINENIYRIKTLMGVLSESQELEEMAAKAKYSLEELETIAKKYNNLTEWKKSKDEYDRKAYHVAWAIKRQGRQSESLTKEDGRDWYNRITAHFVSKRNYHSLEELEAIAKKYSNDTEWMNSEDEYDRKACKVAKNIKRQGRQAEGLTKEDAKDWYKRITVHFVSKINYHSLDEIEAIAKKYNNLTEWKYTKDEYDRKAYAVAVNVKYKGRQAEGLAKEDAKDWYNRITAHFVKIYTKHTLDELEDIAKKYNNLTEWMNSEDEYDRKACIVAIHISTRGRPSHGIPLEEGKVWYKRITAHFEHKNAKYTSDELETIAKKYNNYSEWANSEDEYDRKAYSAAESIKYGGRAGEGMSPEEGRIWYKRITAHFDHKNAKYTLEELEAIAKKFNNPTEWKNSEDEYDRRAYSVAKHINKRGRKAEGITKEDGKDWYNRITGHFTRLYSNGERMVQNFFDENNIKYLYDKHLIGCVTPKKGKKRCGRLRYDFYLKELNILIEYDGRQHYEPVNRFGGEKGLEETKLRDQIKDEFAKSAGIPLIRIKYTYNTQEDINKVMEDVMSSLGDLEPIRRYE